MYSHTTGRNWSKSASIEHIHRLEESLDQLQEYVQKSKEITLMGNGRSYSENCIPNHGISTQYHGKEATLLSKECVIRTGPFTTIHELWNLLEGTNLILPVVPGTGQVTVAGAIASDVHGKSHHRDGSFGEHVLSMRLINGAGEVLELSPTGESSEMFWATVGGMGLTGVIIEAELSLKKVTSQNLRIVQRRTSSVSQTLEELRFLSEGAPYSVAWLDLSTNVKGRGIVSFAYDCEKWVRPQQFPNHKFQVSVPNLPLNLVRSNPISIFNYFWYRKPLKNGISNPISFHHPLDHIRNWNNLFGKQGPIQYQFTVPYSCEGYVYAFLKRCYELKLMSPLVVVKNLRSSNKSFLSFPSEGWTIAVDFARSKKVVEFLNAEINELLSFGGRIYLAKDELINSRHFRSMYPHSHTFREVKYKMDPAGKFQSKLSRKLEI